MSKMQYTRNFCIIAHIDHGKTTLADCLIKTCKTVNQAKMQDQFLDNLKVERQRGITVKSQTICLEYEYKGQIYTLNLIDTPGHVDFHYEVTRTLKACEGTLLVIDATQGIEAQTVSNASYAIQSNLKILPVFNKIDMPAADTPKVQDQMMQVLDIYDDPVLVSAKKQIGISELLEAIITQIPAPSGDLTSPFKALLIDAWYDGYFGIVLLVRVMDGVIEDAQQIEFASNGRKYKVEELGILSPGKIQREKLSAGEIGYIVVNMKTLADCNIGDTVYQVNHPVQVIEGFKKNLPIVFSGVFPVDRDDYIPLGKALERLHINDSSFVYEAMSSPALGLGFKCGFLGMLHMDVITQRLSDEFNMTVILTAPSVSYHVYLKTGEMMTVSTPIHMPEHNKVDYIEEPMVKATILSQQQHLGKVMQLCVDKRGVQTDCKMLNNLVITVWEIPLKELIFDFHDQLKSLSQGYASLDYEIIGYQRSDIVPLNIMINGEYIDALATMIHKSMAYRYGRHVCLQLKDNLDRQQVKIHIQAAVANKVIASEQIQPFRKDVIKDLYGGDRTRKDKLLKKQKKGKLRMSEMAAGNVRISQKAIWSVLKANVNNG